MHTPLQRRPIQSDSRASGKSCSSAIAAYFSVSSRRQIAKQPRQPPQSGSGLTNKQRKHLMITEGRWSTIGTVVGNGPVGASSGSPGQCAGRLDSLFLAPPGRRARRRKLTAIGRILLQNYFGTKISNIDSRMSTSTQHRFKILASGIRRLRARSAARSFATISGEHRSFRGYHGQGSAGTCSDEPRTPPLVKSRVLSRAQARDFQRQAPEGDG